MVRFKNRYITVALDSGGDISKPLNITSTDLYNELINTVEFIHGDVGSSSLKGGLNVRYCNELTKVGIIRARHGPHKILLSVLPFIRSVKEHNISVNLLYVGATLIHCYKELLKYQQSELDKVCSKLNSEEELLVLKSKLLTLDKLKEFDEPPKKQPTQH